VAPEHTTVSFSAARGSPTRVVDARIEYAAVRFSGCSLDRSVRMDSRNKSANDGLFLFHTLVVIAALVAAIQ
jgi:hypothetical protein